MRISYWSSDVCSSDLRGLAADAAVGAEAAHGAVLELHPRALVVQQVRLHQRAGRTGLHALAAGHAGRLPHRVVEVEDHLGAVAAEGHADDVVHLHLAAGPHTAIALDRKSVV